MIYNIPLAPYKVDVKLSTKQLDVRILNIKKLNEILDTIFGGLKSAVVVNETITGGGRSEGVGINNITGLGVEEELSIIADKSSEIIKDLSYDLIFNSFNDDNTLDAYKSMSDALDSASSSTVTYKDRKTSVYVWFEDIKKGLALWETGIISDFPLINCLAFSSEEDKKTVKAYTSKEKYDTLDREKNKWKINREEVIDSPSTGEKYYLIAENNLTSDADAMVWRFTNIHNYSEIAGVDFGSFSFSDSAFNGFDRYGINESNFAGEERIEDEYIINMPQFKKENGEVSYEEAEEMLSKIKSEEEIKQIIKERIEIKIAEENEKARQKGRLLSIAERRKAKKETAEEVSREYVINVLKEGFKNRLISQYSTENSLILYTIEGEDELTSALEDTLGYLEHEDDEVIEGNTEDCEEQVQKILDALGINENTTDEELEKIVKDAAAELIKCIKDNRESENEAVEQIFSELKNTKSYNGLRNDIYEKIKDIDGSDDSFASGVIEAATNYFASGVMNIAIHSGGTAISGVGTSIMLDAKSKATKGKTTIYLDMLKQAGISAPDPFGQAKTLAKGISETYCGGNINSLVIGMMQGGTSPVPLVGSGKQEDQGIKHDTVKILITISAFAAYTMLAAAGIAAMMQIAQKEWDNILKSMDARDGNDLFAMLLAAGIKASLGTTMVTMTETTANSKGTGMLIPFGP